MYDFSLLTKKTTHTYRVDTPTHVSPPPPQFEQSVLSRLRIEKILYPRVNLIAIDRLLLLRLRLRLLSALGRRLEAGNLRRVRRRDGRRRKALLNGPLRRGRGESLVKPMASRESATVAVDTCCMFSRTGMCGIPYVKKGTYA